MENFDDAETFEEIAAYYNIRDAQFLPFGYRRAGQININGIVCVWYMDSNKTQYVSLFLPKSMRGNGAYHAAYRHYCNGQTVLTAETCNLESYLKKKEIPYVCIPGI
jgi:hypothetical protein